MSERPLLSGARVAVAAAVLAFAWAAAAAADDAALLRRSDISLAAPDSFRAVLAVRPLGGSESRRMEVWQREGSVLVRFLERGEEGKFILQRPEGSYFIGPGARQPVRLGTAHRLYGGVTLDEILGLAYSRDFAIDRVERRGEGERQQAVFHLAAKEPGQPYPRVRYVVDVARERPLRVEYLLPSGKVARVVEMLEWGDERLEPEKIAVKDLLRGTRAVEVVFVEVEERDVPQALFELEGAAARAELGED